MEDGKTALIFFYGLFWASALAAVTEFRAFDTAALWRDDTKHLALYRFFAGVLIADLAPLALLWFLYSTNFVVPREQGAGPIMAAALASLAVFFVPRFMHAFLATDFHGKFYSDAEWKEVVAEAKAKEADTFAAHFWPGVAYIVGFSLISATVAKLV